jgi:hypothetical protein
MPVLDFSLVNRQPAPKTLAVIADPVFGSDQQRSLGMVALGSKPVEAQQLLRTASDAGIQWKRLPFTHTEAQQILSFAPETQRQQAFDFASSRATATSSELSQYRQSAFRHSRLRQQRQTRTVSHCAVSGG